jgi:hypothetical protein
VRPPTLSTNQYFPMPKGTQGWVSAYVAPSLDEAGVYLRFKAAAIGDRIFAALQDDKEEIERALGIPVTWRSEGKTHTIAASTRFPGKLLEERAPELHQFLADRVNRFVNVFRPRLEKLAE